MLLLRGDLGRRWTSSSTIERAVVDSPALVRRAGRPLGQGAKRALGVLAAMVVLLATGAVRAAVAACSPRRRSCCSGC